MVDLHSHVLFDMDDGARTIENSIDILKKAKSLGVKKMALTPHFLIGEDVGEFVARRDRHLEILEKKAYDIGIEIVGGAEVYMTDEIFNETELEKLTIGKSKTVLCEFKYHSLSGDTFLEYTDYVLDEGLDVLVAHPERYSYLRYDRFLLKALLSRGVKLQVNASSLFERSEEGEFARMLIDNGIAYCIGSDVHHLNSRRLDFFAELGERKRFEELVCNNPDKLFVKD